MYVQNVHCPGGPGNAGFEDCPVLEVCPDRDVGHVAFEGEHELDVADRLALRHRYAQSVASRRGPPRAVGEAWTRGGTGLCDAPKAAGFTVFSRSRKGRSIRDASRALGSRRGTGWVLPSPVRKPRRLLRRIREKLFHVRELHIE